MAFRKAACTGWRCEGLPEREFELSIALSGLKSWSASPMEINGGLSMISSVSSATRAQPAAASRPAAPSKAPTPAATDTVTISAGKQIVQESIETSSQTTREAANGDNQAKRLLAREAAAKVAAK
jgi:hypothetical protein